MFRTSGYWRTAIGKYIYRRNLMGPLIQIEAARKQNLKIGMTFSQFDVLHAGHIAMLAECKAHCDFLIVGLLTDATIDRPTTKNKPVQSIFERWVQVQAISYIDLLFPFESEQDLKDSLLLIRPDIRFAGEEYKGTEYTAHELEIEMFFNTRKHSFSTTELRNRIVSSSQIQLSNENNK